MMSPLMRFLMYGLAGVTFFTCYQRFTGEPNLQNGDASQDYGLDKHPIGTLGHGIALKDGRRTISRRTVAVADLHGDLQHALNVFRMAGVISAPSPSTSADDEQRWIAGHDVLVSTGDIVDRGDDTIALYRLYQSLRSQAARAGGEVRNLLGNHEVMNAIGDWRYVTQGDIRSFGGVEERRAVMSDKGWIGQDWIQSYNVTTIVPLLPADHPGLPAGYTPPSASFVHGGITHEYASKGIDSINIIGKSFLIKGLSEARPSGWLPSNTSEEEKHLYSESGPLWYRGYATDAESEACDHARQTTQELGVRHLVMGHTPHFNGFVVRCAEDKNSILLIDTGISRAYGGEQSALIIDMDLTPVDKQSNGKRLWKETETLTALYKGRVPKVLARIDQDLWL
ncbi:Metallo-dependent phosphatase [Testicularia cyperi]|uniref:Metallo-dependent phosphatase n=1 Tax=Testicularia cyperi TaxID=1882483 RepID=A0A317XQR4_9BASI|nr:Metallo-dependent phosphatase [Testicularia cyperi]